MASSYIPKRPGRLTITAPAALLKALEKRANDEGRSLSNLAATLLEKAMDQYSGQG